MLSRSGLTINSRPTFTFVKIMAFTGYASNDGLCLADMCAGMLTKPCEYQTRCTWGVCGVEACNNPHIHSKHELTKELKGLGLFKPCYCDAAVVWKLRWGLNWIELNWNKIIFISLQEKGLHRRTSLCRCSPSYNTKYGVHDKIDTNTFLTITKTTNQSTNKV